MYDGVSANGGPKTIKGLLIAFTYFVSLVILGNCILSTSWQHLPTPPPLNPMHAILWKLFE